MRRGSSCSALHRRRATNFRKGAESGGNFEVTLNTRRSTSKYIEVRLVIKNMEGIIGYLSAGTVGLRGKVKTEQILLQATMPCERKKLGSRGKESLSMTERIRRRVTEPVSATSHELCHKA